jgi:hypothetical protein
MRRRLVWVAAFGVVALSVLAGAVLGRDGQRTWALVSTIGVIGLAVLLGVYLVIGWLDRVQQKARAVRHPFRRR